MPKTSQKLLTKPLTSMSEASPEQRKRKQGEDADAPPAKRAAFDAEVQRVFFQRARLSNILAERPPRRTFGGKVLVLDLDTDITVGEALKLLEQHKIVSAPVVRRPTVAELSRGVSGKSCVGVFSAQVALAEAIKAVKAAATADSQAAPTAAEWDRLAAAGRKLCEGRLRSIPFADAQRDLAFAYEDFAGASLEDLLRYAFVDVTGQPVHRVVLCDADKQIVDLISQSDVVRFVHAHLWRLGSLQHATVAELDLGTASPVTVPETVRAGDAIDRMQAAGVSCVGVVRPAEDGRLLGNLSASDLRSMTGDDFYLFSLPVLEFLRRRATGGAAPEAVSCSEGDELREITRRLVDDALHRVWVVDGDGKPLRVITLSDVLSLLLPRSST